MVHKIGLREMLPNTRAQLSTVATITASITFVALGMIAFCALHHVIPPCLSGLNTFSLLHTVGAHLLVFGGGILFFIALGVYIIEKTPAPSSSFKAPGATLRPRVRV